MAIQLTQLLLQNGTVCEFSTDQILESLTCGGVPNFQLVVMSACKSHDCAEMFVKAGIPHVVAINRWHSVLDIACHAFADMFYDALLKGHTVQDAFDKARTHVKHDVRLRIDHIQPTRLIAPSHSTKFRIMKS